jgi:cytochrome c553
MLRFLVACSMTVLIAAVAAALCVVPALAVEGGDHPADATGPAAAPVASAQPAAVTAAAKPDPKAVAADIFKADCCRCHGGERLAAKLDLQGDKLEAALVNVASTEIDTLKLVDATKPDRSYLLLKLKGDERIKGSAMPLRAPALDPAKIKAVEAWIAEVAKAAADAAAPSLGVPIAAPSEAAPQAQQPPSGKGPSPGADTDR